MAEKFDLRLSKIKVVLPNGKPLFAVADLLIPFGQHVLLQGESGRGKTTFLHLLAGLFSPTEGDVWMGETRLNALNDNHRCDLRRENIGVIFQKLNLIDHMTVAENVSLALPPGLSEGVAHIQSAIQRVNLKGRESDRCSFLSLGEQQRVAVARVLAQRANVILADEPTSSLDQRNSGFVLDALIEAAKGKTLIVVSHDQRIASRFQKVIPFEEYAR